MRRNPAHYHERRMRSDVPVNDCLALKREAVKLARSQLIRASLNRRSAEANRIVVWPIGEDRTSAFYYYYFFFNQRWKLKRMEELIGKQNGEGKDRLRTVFGKRPIKTSTFFVLCAILKSVLFRVLVRWGWIPLLSTTWWHFHVWSIKSERRMGKKLFLLTLVFAEDNQMSNSLQSCFWRRQKTNTS